MLGDTSKDVFEASQYGAIMFRHEPTSKMVDGSLYQGVTQGTCRRSNENYTTEETCDYYGGIGMVLHYNYTAFM